MNIFCVVCVLLAAVSVVYYTGYKPAFDEPVPREDIFSGSGTVFQMTEDGLVEVKSEPEVVKVTVSAQDESRQEPAIKEGGSVSFSFRLPIK